MKVAFQGIRGANSEVGIQMYCGPEAEPIGYDYSEQVFEAVLAGDADWGYVPVENSIAGNVAVNMDLLYKYDVSIIAESYVPIQHCLLVHPGVKLNRIRKVFSHPIALAQCRNFLHQYNLLAVPDFDTAGAARAVSERSHPEEAAIAPALCARYYGLEVLLDHIQHLKQNITRFVAFVPGSKVPEDQQREKTSLAFNTRHKPGALVDCLKQFAHYEINMTRLESRPIPENPFVYTFFVDIMGSPREERVRSCLAQMSRYTNFIKILGSYPVADTEVLG